MLNKEDSVIDQALIMYTDGGCRNGNPGDIGWGVHGYLYEKVTPKKGSGNITYILTDKGYVAKSDKDKLNLLDAKEIKPISYFDGFGSSLISNTNNVAELHATTNALIKAKEYIITDVVIFTDSEYVRKGVHEWSPIWRKRNWVRVDGEPVPNAKEWKILLEHFDDLKNKGVNVNIKWIKGHSGNLGNEIADQLATIGVLYSSNKNERSEFKVTTSEGYWKSDVEKHPFINNRRMYFNTLPDSNIKGEYYLGEHGKDDELLGKKISNGAFCVTQLKEPDVILDTIRDYQSELAKGVDSIIMTRLDKVYNPAIYKQLENYGTVGLLRLNPYSLDLSCLDKDPLTKELNPPRLAMRAIEALSTLKSLLENFKSNDSGFQKQDITDLLYRKEITVKKNKEIVTNKFKSEYNIGFCALPVELLTENSNGNCKTNITLTLGIDLLDRNALKRLESLEPVITLITWKETPEVLRYATVIESLGSYGIWAGVYSNMIYISPNKT